MRFSSSRKRSRLKRSSGARIVGASLLLSSVVAAGGAIAVQGAGTDMTLLKAFQSSFTSDELPYGNALRVYAPGLTAIGNKAYFWANDGTKGFEPFSTDGTANGTVSLGDLNASSSSLIGTQSSFSHTSQWELNGYSEFVEVGGKVYFMADPGGSNTCGTKRLFVTDGSTAAQDVETLTGKIVNPAPSSPTPPYLGNILGASGGVVYVHQRASCTFDTSMSPAHKIGDASQLWSYDTATKTLAAVRSSGKYLAPSQRGISVGGITYVAATAWDFDGQSPNVPAYVGGTTAIYRLNGSTATMITPDASYQGYTYPFTDGSNVYYFARVDASTRKVLKIPTTGSATSVSIDPSGGNFLPSAHPLQMADGKFLVSGSVGSSQIALLTDLASSHTTLVTFPGVNGGLITDHVRLGGVDYFIADRKLAKYENGALTTITFSPAINEVNGLGQINGRLVFAGQDSLQEYQLYSSDGTAAGTSIMASAPSPSAGGGIARTGYAPYLGSSSTGTSSPAWALVGGKVLAVADSAGKHRLYEASAPVFAPGAPTIDGVTAGDKQLSVAFTAPSSNGGATITDYEVSTDGGSTFVATGSTTSPIVVTGLTNGSTYSVQVRAVNSAGAGAASASVSGTPVAPPATDSGSTGGGSTEGGSTGGGSTGGSTSGSTESSPTTTPAAGATTTTVATSESIPTLVTAANQQLLTAPVGKAKIVIDGKLVDVDLVQAPEELRRSDPAARTEAQVKALQSVAKQMLSAVQDVAGRGVALPITITNTANGATITGLVTDPVSGKPLAVPVEDVLLVVNDKLALMVGGADGANNPANIAFDGVIEFGSGGYVAVLAYGLTPGKTGEVVIMSTPKLLKSLKVAADGKLAAQAQVPKDIAPGAHTVVVTVGDQAASLGFRVLPPKKVSANSKSTRTLPATGSDTSMLPLVALVLAAGGVAALVATRRRKEI